jgi:hypothetical protein
MAAEPGINPSCGRKSPDIFTDLALGAYTLKVTLLSAPISGDTISFTLKIASCARTEKAKTIPNAHWKNLINMILKLIFKINLIVP